MIINLAIGPRTFRPSIFGKAATVIDISMCVVVLYENWRGQYSFWVDFWIYAVLVITLISAFHYISHVGRIINKPASDQP
jgi:hypothetical protein